MQPLPIFSPSLSKNIVKIAIQAEGKIPQLFELHQKKPLSDIIEEICLNWKIADHYNYCLEFSEHSLYIFVQEKNRSEIKNGNILLLQSCPENIVENVISVLSSHSLFHGNENKASSLISSSKYGTAGNLVAKFGFTNYYHVITNNNNLNEGEPCKDVNISECLKCLKSFSRFCSDPYFAQLFINKGGLDVLVSAIHLFESDRGKKEYGKPLSTLNHTLYTDQNNWLCNIHLIEMHLLISFDELIQNGFINWDDDFEKTLHKVTSYLKDEEIENDLLRPVLSILDAFTLNWFRAFGIIFEEIKIYQLIPFLNKGNAETQLATLILLNSLLNKSIEMGDIYKLIEELLSHHICDVIQKSFFKYTTLDAEIVQQLNQLQRFLFFPIKRDMNMEFDGKNQEHMQIILSFQSYGFNIMDLFRSPQSLENDLGIINFTGDNNKVFDTLRRSKARIDCSSFSTLNPKDLETDILPHVAERYGFLALKNLGYLVSNYGNLLAKIVHEHPSRTSANGFSLFKIVLHVTRMLGEILKMSDTEMDNDDPGEYYLMFYSVPFPYQELFVVTFNLFNKTWKEMRASSSEDFKKVFTVVREQISRALDMNPLTFDKFKQDLSTLSYPNLNQIWQRERYYKEELESQAPAIMELKEHIKPRIMGIIVEHRLNFMKKGTLFTKYSSAKSHRLKDKLWHCQLSVNNKTLYYGPAADDGPSNNTESQNRESVSISEIASIKLGKDMHQAKEMKNKKATLSLLMTLNVKDDRESLSFIAPDLHTLCLWNDGLNYLLSNEVRSQDFKNDLETILSMEIKIALLELETLTIPESPLCIPDDPIDYNFINT